MKTSICKRRLLPALWLILPGAFPGMVAAGDNLTPFEVSYDVDHKFGNGKSYSKLSILDDGETYIYETRIEPKGLASLFIRGEPTETTRFKLNDGRIVTEEWKFLDGSKRGKRNQNARFDRSGGTVQATYKGKTVTLELTPGLMDRHAVTLALRRDFANGSTVAEYEIINRNSLRTYKFEITGEEIVDTPQGRLSVIKILRSREGSSRSAELWVAPELNYMPVRAVQYRKGKRQLEMTLRSFKWDEDTESLAQQ